MINTTYVRNMAFRCEKYPEVVAALNTCATELDMLYEEKKKMIATSLCKVIVIVDDDKNVHVSLVDKKTGQQVPVEVAVKYF